MSRSLTVGYSSVRFLAGALSPQKIKNNKRTKFNQSFLTSAGCPSLLKRKSILPLFSLLADYDVLFRVLSRLHSRRRLFGTPIHFLQHPQKINLSPFCKLPLLHVPLPKYVEYVVPRNTHGYIRTTKHVTPLDWLCVISQSSMLIPGIVPCAVVFPCSLFSGSSFCFLRVISAPFAEKKHPPLLDV